MKHFITVLWLGLLFTPVVFSSEEGRVEFRNRQYRAYTEQLNWHQAKHRCEAMGGYLATLTNEEENAFVTSLIRSNSWIGGFDENLNKNWSWVTGETFKFKAWHAKQPDNAGNVEAGLILWTTGVWNDITRDARRAFVCEWGNYASDN